jgi:hypothetical protein
MCGQKVLPQALETCNFYFFHAHLDNYQNFFPPTDTQLGSLKNNFKFASKLTLKLCYMFRCEKQNCNFSKAQKMCSLRIVFFHTETCSSLLMSILMQI